MKEKCSAKTTKTSAKGEGLRRPKKFDESREVFLQAAFEVFAEKGFHASSIDDIVEKAGRSKGGFYHHFESKNQLYSELFNQMLAQTGKAIDRGIARGNSARNVLLGILDDAKPLIGNPNRLRAAVDFFLLSLRNEEPRTMVRLLHQRSVELFTPLFQHAIDRREFRSTVGARELADLIFVSGRGIMIMSMILDDGRELFDRLSRFVNLQLQALELSPPTSSLPR